MLVEDAEGNPSESTLRLEAKVTLERCCSIGEVIPSIGSPKSADAVGSVEADIVMIKLEDDCVGIGIEGQNG